MFRDDNDQMFINGGMFPLEPIEEPDVDMPMFGSGQMMIQEPEQPRVWAGEPTDCHCHKPDNILYVPEKCPRPDTQKHPIKKDCPYVVSSIIVLSQKHAADVSRLEDMISKVDDKVEQTSTRLNDFIIKHDQQITDIYVKFDQTDSSIARINTSIAQLVDKTSEIDSSINLINSSITEIKGNIDHHTAWQKDQDASISALKNKDIEIDSSISSLKAKDIEIDSSITRIESSLGDLRDSIGNGKVEIYQENIYKGAFTLNSSLDISINLENGVKISDGETVDDKTWSSQKISSELETKQNNLSAGYGIKIENDSVINDLSFTPSDTEASHSNFIDGQAYAAGVAFQKIANLFEGSKESFGEINAKIPSQASASNQLADRNFVNSTVLTSTANFRGVWVSWEDVPNTSSAYPQDYSGNKEPSNNDYLVIQDASTYNNISRGAQAYDGQWRFVYVGKWGETGKNGWKPQYRIGHAFTADQQAAIDSGITDGLVQQIGTNQSDIDTLNSNKVNKLNTANKIYATGNDGLDYGLNIGAGLAVVDGSLVNTRTSAEWGNISGNISDQLDLSTALDDKQGKLTAGANIFISEDNVISSTATESFFRGRFSTWSSVPTDTSQYVPDYLGNKKPTENDYMFIKDAQDYDEGGGVYLGAWRFAYHGEWENAGKSGWKPEYQIEDVVPAADSSTAGIAKLYDTSGNNIDGAVTQRFVTEELNKKSQVIIKDWTA